MERLTTPDRRKTVARRESDDDRPPAASEPPPPKPGGASHDVSPVAEFYGREGKGACKVDME